MNNPTLRPSNKLRKLRRQATTPTLLGVAFDTAASAILAWIFPTGLNLLLAAVGSTQTLDTPRYFSAAVFLVTVLLLYGAQVTTTLKNQAAFRDEEILERISSLSGHAIEQAIHVTLAPLLIGGSTPTKVGVDLLGQLGRSVADAPPHLASILPRTITSHLDAWRRQLADLESTGVNMPLGFQIELLQDFERECREFILIDRTIYNNVRDDWTPIFRDQLSKWRSSPSLRTYIQLYTSDDPDRQSTDKGIRDLRQYLEGLGWSFYVCNERSLLDDDPAFDQFTRELMEVFDQSIVIRMRVTERFTGAQRVLTRITGVDDELRRYLAAVRHSMHLPPHSQ